MYQCGDLVLSSRGRSQPTRLNVLYHGLETLMDRWVEYRAGKVRRELWMEGGILNRQASEAETEGVYRWIKR